MQVPHRKLNPLSSSQLTADEQKILKWMRSVAWEPQKDAREPIPYKAKVPEFHGGIRLYHMQANNSASGLGPLELFIKKLSVQGIITKQDLYPMTTQGTARYVALKKEDLDNLGIGKDNDNEE